MSFLKGIIADALVSAKVAEPQPHQVQSTTVPGMQEQGGASHSMLWNPALQSSELPATNVERQGVARQSFTDSTMPSVASESAQSVGTQAKLGASLPTLQDQTPPQREIGETPGKTATHEIDLSIGSDGGGLSKETIPNEDVSNVYGESAVFSRPIADAYENEIFHTAGHDEADDAERVEIREELPAATSVASYRDMENSDVAEYQQSISVRTADRPAPAAREGMNKSSDFGGADKIQSSIYIETRDASPTSSAPPHLAENSPVPDQLSKQHAEARQMNKPEVTGEESAPPAIQVLGKRAERSERRTVQSEAQTPPAHPQRPLSPPHTTAEPIPALANPAPQKDEGMAGQQRRDKQSESPSKRPQPSVVQRAVPSQHPNVHRSTPTLIPASSQTGEIKPPVQAKNLPVNRPPRRLDTPQVNRPRPMPSSPEVRIGQVDVFIEAPKATTPARRNVSGMSASGASRRYLRRV